MIYHFLNRGTDPNRRGYGKICDHMSQEPRYSSLFFEKRRMIFDAWSITQQGHVPEHASFYETLFSLANGYTGVRPTLEFESSHAVPGAFSDLYDPALATRSEIANAPNWLPLRFRLGGDEPIHWDRIELLDFSN